MVRRSPIQCSHSHSDLNPQDNTNSQMIILPIQLTNQKLSLKDLSFSMLMLSISRKRWEDRKQKQLPQSLHQRLREVTMETRSFFSDTKSLKMTSSSDQNGPNTRRNTLGCLMKLIQLSWHLHKRMRYSTAHLPFYSDHENDISTIEISYQSTFDKLSLNQNVIMVSFMIYSNSLIKRI